MRSIAPTEVSLSTVSSSVRGLPGERRGWFHWRGVWAAWCPTCEQETMPLPSGRCAFCDTHLAGQPTRAAGEPPLMSSAVVQSKPQGPSFDGSFVKAA